MLKSFESKISLLSHISMAVGVIALMVVAAFYDLEISHALSNVDSLFGQIFVTLGEFPAYIILPISGSILFYNSWKGNKASIIAIRTFCVLMIYMGYVLWGIMGSRLVEVPNILGQSLIYSAIFTPVTIGIASMASRESMRALAKWSVFAVVTLALTLALSRLMKAGWGRMRYRDMVAVNDFSGFTNWYNPQGFGSDNSSFPSGHTSSACNIFIFAVLFDFKPKLSKYKYLAYAIAAIFTILTGISRIVINAHFLSDVVVGGVVSYFIYYITKISFFKKSGYTFQLSLGRKNV